MLGPILSPQVRAGSALTNAAVRFATHVAKQGGIKGAMTTLYGPEGLEIEGYALHPINSPELEDAINALIVSAVQFAAVSGFITTNPLQKGGDSHEEDS